MFNNNMTYPTKPWNESEDGSEKMRLSRQLAEATRYPVDLFPPVLRDVIVALCRDVDAPIELITGTVLSAVSLACQAFVSIQFPDGRVKPCSLYNLIIADSGERKSTIYSLVMKPFLAFEKEDKKDYNSALQGYDTEMLVWNVKKKVFLKQLNKKIEANKDFQSEQEDLELHVLLQPMPPKRMKLIYTDTTPEAMQRGLHDNMSTAGLMSDEASVFFEGRAKNNLGFLNELWDGAQIDIERRSQKSFSLDDTRFTMLLMVQYDVFIQYLKKNGKKAAGSGFLSRFLISFIPSSAGARLSSRNTVHSTELACFHGEIQSLLSKFKEPLKDRKTTILRLDPYAQMELENFYRDIEREVSWNLKNNTIKSSLMKLAENALRIAGLMHYFQYRDKDEISRDTLLCAITLAGCYGNQGVDLFSTALATPEQDAEYVFKWMTTNSINALTHGGHIARSFVRRNIGSTYLRNSERLNAALQFLEQDDRIWIKEQRNPNGSITKLIHLK